MDDVQLIQLNVLDGIIKNNWVCADVGACRGEILNFLIKKSSYCYAFEPDISNFNYLSETFKDKNVEISDSVVSDVDGQIKFYNTESHVGNILGHDMSFNKLNNFYFRNSITLDSFFENKHVDFIKLDVEGAEWKVFEGAKNLLKNRNIIWQVEFHLCEDWCNRSILFDNGYSIYHIINSDNIKKLNELDGRVYQALLIKE